MKKTILLLTLVFNLIFSNNYVLDFDRSNASFGAENDNISLSNISNNPIFTDLSNGYTFECWVNMQGYGWTGNSTAHAYIISGIANGFIIDDYGQLHWAFLDNNGTVHRLITPYQFPLNEWRHVAIAYEDNVAYLFDNGNLVESLDIPEGLSLNWSADSGFSIGIAHWPNGWWHPIDGQLENIRISNYARYTNSFSPTYNYNTDENTVLLWKLNEGSGSTANDLSGNGFHGNISEANWMAYDFPLDSGCTDYFAENYEPNAELDDGNCEYPNNGDYSLNFDDGSKYVSSFNNSNDLRIADDLTVMLNYRSNNSENPPVNAGLITCFDPGEESSENSLYAIEMYDGRLHYSHEYGVGQNQTYHTNLFIHDGEMHHIIVSRTIEDKVVEFYDNGELVDSYNYSNNPEHGEQADLTIGIVTPEYQEYPPNGRIDNVKIYSESYSHISEENLVVDYKFNEGEGDVLYDHSGGQHHGTIYGNSDWIENVYGCMDLSAFNYNPDADFDDESCVYSPFTYNQSQNQSFYYFQSATIDDENLDSEDWVGAFKGDVCVGAKQWDTSTCLNGICEIVIMGNDGTEYTTGYMEDGDIPTFKIYDESSEEIYDAVTSEEISWSNLSFNVIENLNVFPDCNGTFGGDVWNDDNDCACNDVDQCPGLDDCLDTDGDTISDCLDECPLDPENDADQDGLCCYSLVSNHNELYFDGDNDYINSGNAIFDYLNNSFTYELLVKPDKEIDIPAVPHIPPYNYSGGNQNYIVFPELIGNGTGLSIGTNGLHVFEHGGGYLYPVLTYEFDDTIDDYLYVTVRYVDGTPQLFINGEFKLSGENNGTPASPSPNLGGYVTLLYDWTFYEGYFKSYAIWDTAISEDQITLDSFSSLSGNENNLVGLWDTSKQDMDSTLYDLTNSGNNGEITGATWIEDSTIVASDPCCYDPENDIDGDGLCCSLTPISALHFDGDVDYVSIPNSDEFDNLGNNFTFEIEYYANNSGALLSKRIPCHTESFYLSPNGYSMQTEQREVYFNDEDIYDWGKLNQWNQMTVAYDGDSIRFYINQDLLDTKFASGNMMPDVNTFRLGVRELPGECDFVGSFDGYISELRIWNKSLDQSEIIQFSNQNLIGNEDNLVGYYSFTEGNGSGLYDLTENENNGTIFGAEWLEITDVQEDPCCHDSENDSDLDGVCGCTVEDCSEVDPVDQCQGFDDNLDVNENTYPDDCECCMDVEAQNHDEICIYDDGSCYYGYGQDDDDSYLDYHEGANLTSFYVLPDITGYVEEYPTENLIPNPFNVDDFIGLAGENSSAFYFEQIGGLIGSLTDINRVSGYWLKLNNNLDAYLEGFRTPSDIQYNLHEGNNLVSFPADAAYSLEDVLPDNLTGIVTKIYGEGIMAAYNDDWGGWAGSLVNYGLEGFNGYWMVSSEDIDFSYTIPEDALSRQVASVEKQILPGYEYTQSSMQSFYFVKEFPEANIGDWIISYHNDVVVGTRRWDGQMVDIPVMGYDGQLYSFGYTEEGISPSFKLYDIQTGELKDLYGSIPSFINNEVFILETLTTDVDGVPGEVSLSNAYPNPFNPVTNISFTLPSSMQVEVNILDIQGRLVEKLTRGMYTVGTHDIVIEAGNLSSGVYFVQLVTDNKVDYQKIMLLK